MSRSNRCCVRTLPSLRQMDFATRDHYRHVVKIAKSSLQSESEVALNAIWLARASTANKDGTPGRDDRMDHVGYYLIDKGLPELEELADVRLSVSGALRKVSTRFPLLLYLGTITLMTVIFTGSLLEKAYAGGSPECLLALIGIFSMLGASQLAVELVNWLATLLVTPHQLPRMDYSKGIPPESRTLAVIPTMLISAQNIVDLIVALEVRFLANRDENLHFGLLTDFQDSAEEKLPEDEPLLLLARQRIEELNEKYRNAKGDTFFLFHRPRRWNAQERVWMGYERKRGKLSELNSFLRGGPRDRFSLIAGNTAILSNVKYVITLDTDTQLPRDSARQFAGAMAHPLNSAHYDEDKAARCCRHGILQPRVAPACRAQTGRVCANVREEPGIDPYTRAVSDVYQTSSVGLFIGKGDRVMSPHSSWR